VRRLVYVNLVAAAAIAGFGFYAYSLTRTQRVQISGTSRSWVDPSGVAHGSGTRIWITSVTHPHAAWAYAAWAIALLICVMSLRGLRVDRRRAEPSSDGDPASA